MFLRLNEVRAHFPNAQLKNDELHLEYGFFIEETDGTYYLCETYYDRDVGYVTDDDVHSGTLEECLAEAKKRLGE